MTAKISKKINNYTADDIKGTSREKRVHIELSFSLRKRLAYVIKYAAEYASLFIENPNKAIQNLKVKGWSQ